MPDNHCRIWPQSAVKKVSDIWNDPGAFNVLDSPRAGGSYQIGDLSDEWCEHHNDEASQRVKTRLTTWLIDERLKSVNPFVSYQQIQQALVSPGLSTSDRANRLLRKLASYPSRIIDVTQSTDMVQELLAWSESVKTDELNHLITKLQRDGFVYVNGKSISVTESGHQHIQELDNGPKPKLGF